jgi:hypothetical protein
MEKPKGALLATGIITRIPAPADEVKLLVLNALGAVVSESSKLSPDAMVTLGFSASLMDKAGTEPYFLLVKGFTKGNLAWEQRLGYFRFHV